MWEKRKSKHEFGEAKARKAEEVRKYFVNPKVETEVFENWKKTLKFLASM